MRAIHRIAGALMVAPLLVWTVTGVLLARPGHANPEGEPFVVPTASTTRPVTVRPDGAWNRAIVVGTVLGNHLLLETDIGWRHLDPVTGNPKPPPSERQLRSLLEDGFSHDPDRYGSIVSVGADSVVTDTGRRILLEWESLTAVERGPETDNTLRLRRFHRLAFTGDDGFDRGVALGASVLAGLLVLLGIALLFGGKPQAK